MNVDTDNEVDTNSTSAHTDSDANGSAPADNQSTDTTGDATSTADESGNADNQGDAANGSLTDRAEQHQQNSRTDTNPGKDFVPRREYASLQAEFTRRSQRIKEMEKAAQEYDGVKPEDVRAWKAAQETAKKSNLPRWSPNHPEHDRFKGLRERYQFAQGLLARAKPEDREARRAEISGAFAPEELKALEEWKAHEADFHSRLASDPEGTMAQMMDERIQQAMQQREQQSQRKAEVSSAVDGWFDDPNNRAVIHSQREWMQGALAENIPWAVVRREAEIRHMRGQLKSGQKVAQSAEEKERLLRGNASVSRDTQTRGQPVGDLYDRAKAIARQRNYPPGDARFMDILDELQAQE